MDAVKEHKSELIDRPELYSKYHYAPWNPFDSKTRRHGDGYIYHLLLTYINAALGTKFDKIDEELDKIFITLELEISPYEFNKSTSKTYR